MRCYSSRRFAAEEPDRNGVMVERYRTIADRDGEHDVAKKPGCLFSSCVNPCVANLCLALGARFGYVRCTIGLLVEADETSRDPGIALRRNRYRSHDKALNA